MGGFKRGGTMEDSEILMSINRDLYLEMKKKHMETYNKNEKLMLWADMLGAIFAAGVIVLVTLGTQAL